MIAALAIAICVVSLTISALGLLAHYMVSPEIPLGQCPTCAPLLGWFVPIAIISGVIGILFLE